MLRVAIGTLGLQNWFAGDFSRVVELARLAEEKGVDEVNITDHVIMGEAVEKYPYGPFAQPLDYPWYEPMVVLAAIAAGTQSIRLSTGILIAPLRPAVLLAKQIATLDVMSRGRVDIGFGVGWQREEYDAAGVPFEGRFDLLFEQIDACRVLWSQAPASFHGKTINFDRIYCLPQPVQKKMTTYFGLAPTNRNFARIAEYGDGWQPMEKDPTKLRDAIARLRDAFVARGRDPDHELTVRLWPNTVRGSNGKPDLDATLAQVPELRKVGVNMISMNAALVCGPDDYEKALEKLVALKS